jgi:hypothetical protein
MITQNQVNSFRKGITSFLLRSIIGLGIVLILIDIFIPDIRGILGNIQKNEKVSLLLYSFVQNPEALYQASLLDSNVGNNKKALMEINLAIGLLEMHNSQSRFMKKYLARKKELEESLSFDNK